MEKVFYTGIDQHKRTSVFATADTDGNIVQEAKLKNNPALIRGYFQEMPGPHVAVVESTSGWYWMSDLLQQEGIELKLAHAKYLKAISYAKVKTDKVDAVTLAQLLRVGMIPEAHKISTALRGQRDTLRTRLRLVEKRSAALNSVHRLLEKFNGACVDELPELYQLQAGCHLEQIETLDVQIKSLERALNEVLIPNADIQRLLWVPGIGRINAFTLYLEVGRIARFGSVGQFHSYCRLVPGSNNSAGNVKHQRSKDGNRYLKLAFSHAAVRAVQYYPEIRRFYQSRLRRKNKMIARALVAKEIARIVYYVLRTREPYNGKFKGETLERTKLRQWPRLASPAA